MKLTTRIAIRHLRSHHSFGFISFSTILSIIGLIIGIASLIIISCISRGFNNTISFKLSGIDGHMRINNYLSDNMHMGEIAALDSNIHLYTDNIEFTSPYIEKHAIVRNGHHTEAILLYGVEESSLQNIFHLEQFTTGTLNFNYPKSIIIGQKLAQSIEAKIGDNIMIMNIEKMSQEQIFQVKNFTITNIFKTDFPEYDRLLAFIPVNTADAFFEMDNTVSGLMLNVRNPEEVELLDYKLSDTMNLFPLTITTWKERHSGLLEWLTLYDIPIKLMMIFITSIGIFNIAASLWMIIIEKTRDFGIMKSMGMSQFKIQEIILKEGALIGLAGIFGGMVLSVIILYLQNTYHFIQISNDIYFMNYLPVDLAPIYFLIYPICAFVITILLTYYPAYRASRISSAEALRYE